MGSRVIVTTYDVAMHQPRPRVVTWKRNNQPAAAGQESHIAARRIGEGEVQK
jgi:hypothetical protein